MLSQENQLPFKLFFNNLLTILAALIVFAISFSGTANAQKSNIYLVEGNVGQASEKSSNEAKITAIAMARKNAFATLLSRLSLDAIILNDMTSDDIFDMVHSEQITDERISANSYYAVLNIMFSVNNVERILKEKNVRRGNSLDKTFLLIPVKVLKQQNSEIGLQQKLLLWEEDNDWMVAVEKEIQSSSMFNFIVPKNDLSNIASLNKDNIDKITYEDLESLLVRYRSEESLIMFFYYDDIENKVTISIQDIKKLQKKRIKLSFVNVDRLSYESLINKVAEKTLGYLKGLKNSDSVKIDKNFVKIEIPISSLSEWLMIKSKIENTHLVSQLNIESISKDYAKISINYIENDTNIIKSFAKKNIKLIRKSNNLFSLSIKKH